jgi:hypothetical protein
MRILAAGSEGATLPMRHPAQALALRRAVALQLVGHADAGHRRGALAELAKTVLDSRRMAPAQHQALEHVIVLIHDPPQGMALPVKRQTHLVHRPCIPRAWPSALELVGVIVPTLPTPRAEGLVRHLDAALEQEFWHVAVASRVAVSEPDALADGCTGEAVVLVACGISGWRHVWLPIGVCERYGRVPYQREYLTSQAAGSTT